jgi:hypothetical protein
MLQQTEAQGYELEARYDTRQSFYGKARVEIASDGTKRLWSYNTHVASIKPGVKPMVFDLYSATTTRHIKEFLLQNGFVAKNSKQIIKDYGEEAHNEKA